MHAIEIEDNGIGIEKKYHEQIFELFKRLQTRKSFTGAGLGLSIAQRLVEKIGGTISILRSQENKGSAFLICLPVSIEVEN